MRVEIGFVETSCVVHLTHTTLSRDAICGHDEPIVFHGEPDLTVICDDCDRLARDLGLDPADWMRNAAVTLVLADAA